MGHPGSNHLPNGYATKEQTEYILRSPHVRPRTSPSSIIVAVTQRACVLLGGYEVLDGSCVNSWISHTRGIRYIMCARGPLAHKSGMGRTLMICIRPFLLAEAFVLGEPCFLGNDEWRSITEAIPSERGQNGQASQLTLIMDHTFNEIARCPGYCVSTKSILCSPTDSSSGIAGLLSGISDSKARLLKLQEMLNIGHTGPRSDISPTYMKSMTRLTLVGLNTALALLDNLSTVLESDSERKLAQHQASLALGVWIEKVQDPWRISAERYSMCLRDELHDIGDDITSISSTMQPIGDRLDTFSLTMGIGSILQNQSGV